MKQRIQKLFIVIFSMLMTFTNMSIVPVHAEALPATDRDKIITEAEKHLGKPYVWGATGPDAFDCSGYTQYVFKHSIGYNLERVAEDQRQQLIREGKEISKNDKSKWKPGDLLFFGNHGEAEHVAIWYGNDKIIHALGDKVQINRFDELIDKDGQQYEIMTVIKTIEDVGGFTILKIDENDKALSGAVFKITKPDGTTVKKTSDSKGKVIYKNAEIGRYKVQEITAPNGKLINDTVKTIDVKSGWDAAEHVYKFVNNSPTGKITLTKYNSDKSATVPETTYHVTSTNGYDAIHTTNVEGKIVLENLELSTYTFVETKSADGYLIDSEPITIELKYKDQNTAVIVGSAEHINREPKARILLEKEDAETKIAQGDATLLGAVYEVTAAEDIYNKAKTHKYYSKGEVVATRTTDTDGKMDPIESVPLGHYQLKEKTPSTGYLIDPKTYDIHCEYEGQTVHQIVRSQTSKEQVKKQAFQILKISSDGSSDEAIFLEGAQFTVKLKSEVDKKGWEQSKTYDILTTDKRGYAKSAELPYGTYLVKETKKLDNLLPVKDFIVKIENDSREPQEWRIMNDAPFKALVKAVKIDKDTGKTVLLPGTTFKIKNLSTDEYVGQWVFFPVPHYVTEFVTDASGTFTTPNTLMPGKYRLEEIKAPSNYILDQGYVDFEVSSNAAYEIAPDGMTPIISVTKSDTSVKGKISVSKLGEQLVSTEKDKQGNIQFIYEKKPVDGAKFIIEAAEDIMSADNQKDVIYTKGTKVAELTTRNGKATTDLLPLGKYKVYEQIAGETFVLNTEVKDVELTYEDQETEVVSENTQYINERQKVKLDIVKLDRETDTPLLDAEFGLYASESIKGYDGKELIKKGTLIEKVMSDKKGMIAFKSDLPINAHFQIKELKAPIGYASTDEIIKVDTSYKGQESPLVQIKRNVKNDITKVEISKKDATTGEELPGAQLVLKEKDGSIYDTWISTNEPHIIKGLEPNKVYELIETSSPYGFALSQKIEFKVKDTGEVQKVEMKDDLVVGHLKWQKIGEVFNHTITGANEFGVTQTLVWEKQNLLNAYITIYAAEDITLGNGVTYWQKDEAIETLESDYDPVQSQELLVGRYYYIESKDLHGYVTDTEKHYFEIQDNQSLETQIVESTLENKRPVVNVGFTKFMESMKDHEELAPWNDVIFGIYAREDTYDYMGNVAIPNGTLIDTTGIDELGQFDHFPDLPNGTYYVKELQTNHMYKLDTKEYDFEIGWHGGDVSEYTIKIGDDGNITNELQRGKIYLHKTDKDTHKALVNVRFTIATDKGFNNYVQSGSTDHEGYLEFSNLELGKYYIKEDPVDGYVTNDHIYEIEIKQDGDELGINVENKPLEMEFSKVDITTGKELPGAKMTVTEKESGVIIDEWVSGNETHKIKYLVQGKEYILKEVTAPQGYEIAESITFKAEDGQKITMKDRMIPEVPQTGDTTNIALYIGSAMLSLALLAGLWYMKRKRETNDSMVRRK